MTAEGMEGLFVHGSFVAELTMVIEVEEGLTLVDDHLNYQVVQKGQGHLTLEAFPKSQIS